jgi:hypothetical protein
MLNLRTTLAAALAALSINAHAVGLPTDGSWIEFDFGTVGSSIYDLSTLDTSFDFSLGQDSVVRVVDLGLAGDRFEIFANGVSLGATSAVLASDAESYDPAAAWADPSFSRGSWLLGAGSYSITGTVAVSPYDGGYGAMSVTAVPEPESYAMMLAGLALVGFAARRARG